MSDLMDDLNISEDNISNGKCENLQSDDEVISINVVENTSQNKEKSDGAGNKKTIKVKITIRGENNVQIGQERMKITNSSTPFSNGKMGNRNICIIDEFDDDSLSLVLKSPRKQKRIEYTKITTPNNKKEPISINKSLTAEGNNDTSCDCEKLTELCMKNQSEKDHEKIEIEKSKSLESEKLPIKISNTTYQKEFHKGYEKVSPFVTNNRLTKQQSSLEKESFSSPLLRNSKNYTCKKAPFNEIKEFIEKEKRQFTLNMERNTPPTHNLGDTSCKNGKSHLKGASKKFIEVEQRESTSRGHLYESNPPMDRSNDSLIVRDIIMEHYQDVLNYFNNKSAKKENYRRSISLTDEKIKPKLEQEAVENPLSISLHENMQPETQTNKKSLDSGLHDMTKSNNTLKSLGQNEEEIEYDSKEFLMAALGEDMMTDGSNSEIDSDIRSTPASSTSAFPTKYDMEKSVGSSQISSLVSTTDCKSAIYSLYSTVKKTSKKRPALMKKKPVVRSLYTSSGYDHYESVEFTEYLKLEELTRNICTFQGIVTQSLNAVKVCKNEPKLYGSIHHLEAERILLLSTHKLEMLNRECNKYGYEEVERKESSGTINVSRLRFSSIPHMTTEKAALYYYLCIIQSGTTVLATDIVSADKSGEILFQDNFQFGFNTLLSEMEINVSIYSISIRNKEIKNNSCFTRNRIYSSWKTKKENNNNEATFSEISSTEFLGNCRIGAAVLCREDKFTLNKMPLYSSISETFEADIGINLKMNTKLSGFLTIRTKNILWNRRWCVLDGFLLKYWNWPAEENDREPLEIIDLRECITENVSSVNKSICSRSRTFLLEIKSQMSSEFYFLSADNLSELSHWKQHINVILETLRLCNNLKCETVLM